MAPLWAKSNGSVSSEENRARNVRSSLPFIADVVQITHGVETFPGAPPSSPRVEARIAYLSKWNSFHALSEVMSAMRLQNEFLYGQAPYEFRSRTERVVALLTHNWTLGWHTQGVHIVRQSENLTQYNCILWILANGRNFGRTD